MKKKILALCLVVALAATAVIGGTLAYFTDTDKADNVFTVGGVKIDLIEQERDGNGRLQDFSQNKTLMPIVGSAQGDKDELGMPTAENYVDKIITVKNTGKSDAYVRMFLAIPVVLDNVGDASQNILHFNFGTGSDGAGQWTKEACVAENVNVKGVQCNIYSRTYTTKLAENEVTATAAYQGFYLDKNVDMNENGQYTINGTVINYDFTKGVTIPVFAQGIQAAGFKATETQTAAEVAFAQSGLPTNPWATPAA